MIHYSRDIWKSPPAILPLTKDEVHVWCINLSVPSIPVDAHLSEAERERASRFHFNKDRNRFIVSHEALRVILSHYLGVTPEAIKFGHGTQGKPNLDPTPTHGGLTFNLSHSSEFALVAVGLEREVGVDVEKMRPNIDLERIARSYFSTAEVERLCAFPDSLHLAAFYRCWTRKEAYIKARGGGLYIQLDQFDVTLDPEIPAALLATRNDPREASKWSLYNVELCEGYQAALAAEGAPEQIHYWEYINSF